MGYYKIHYRAIITVLVIAVIVAVIMITFRRALFTLPNFRPYLPVWTEKEKTMMKELLRKATTVLGEHHIDMILICGSLLGLIRHKGVIPWDDDIDVMISNNSKDEFHSLENVLKTKNIGMVKQTPHTTKLFPMAGKKVPGTDWKWPFIDVFFYQIEGRKIKIQETNNSMFGKIIGYNTTHILDEKDVFPLKNNLFEGIPVNLPNNSDKVLNEFYGSDWETTCVSSSYNHKMEQSQTGGWKVSCKDLVSSKKEIYDNVWVINLERRKDRWELVNKRLRALGLNPRKWIATDAQDPSFNKLYEKLKTTRLKGEVACYMSHLKLWKHLQKLGVKDALIFEDDVIPAQSINLSRIREAIDKSHGYKIILLGYCGGNFSTVIDHLMSSNAVDTRVGTGQCTHAYAISNRGLDAILSEKHDFSEAVDEKVENFCSNNLCYITRELPAANNNTWGSGFFHQDLSMPSDILK